MKKLIEVERGALQETFFEAAGNDMMLLCAGNATADFNMMTVSWATVGILWNRPVVTVFVRPQRRTFDFMEREDMFSVCVLPDSCRDILNVCGAKSGREIDKTKLRGLTPRFDVGGAVAFDEAERVLVCRKLYADDIDPKNFLHEAVQGYYPQNDYHRFYIGEIVHAYQVEK